jgi:predicted membrane-bound spermidine synthase
LSATPTTRSARPGWIPRPDRADAILFLAGVNLMLAQLAGIRELATLAGANELVILATTIGCMLGASLGSALARRIDGAALLALALATAAFHLSLPFSPRWAAAWLHQAGLAALIPWIGTAAGLLALTPFQALLLPRIVAVTRASSPGAGSLARPYAWEVTGGLAALGLVAALPAARMDTVMSVNLVAMLATLALVFPRINVLAPVVAILPVAYLLAWDPLHRASLRSLYRGVAGLEGAEIVASEYSRYQRVDLVRHSGETLLYLNGNLLYGTRPLHVHNLLVATAPSWFAAERPPAVLLVAGGSLDNVRSLAPRVARLDVVEIDETVVRLAREHIQDPRRGFPAEPWNLVIDDGKRFLAAPRAYRYDLIALDLAVPTFAQASQLYSARFLRRARENLEPGGILSVALGGHLEPRAPGEAGSGSGLANRIAAGLAATFPHVTVVRVGSRDYAWASQRPLGVTGPDLQGRVDQHLESRPDGRVMHGSPVVRVLDDRQVRAAVAGFEPVADADVRLALDLSWRKLRARFGESASRD